MKMFKSALNKSDTISKEAKKNIDNLRLEGFDIISIIFSMEDDAFLKKANISKEIAEEIHNFLIEGAF